ncbi:hypothetical protein F4860DRAFT_476355 [Xylaria cubensis]|nr:hypothetical protein F4860DRAFT_476355 [Xylaria cubensis]
MASHDQLTACINCIDIFRPLLEKGGNIEATSKYGSTVLHYAAYHGQADFVQLLLEKGANI